VQAQFSISPVRPETRQPKSETTTAFAYAFAGLAIASIWISVVLASVFGPDFVSGSHQEHLPLVGFTAWLWGAIATGIVVLTTIDRTRTGPLDRASWIALGVGVSLVWLGVLLVALFAPAFVTGTDPTRIPLASMGAGILGVFGTWFVCLFVKALGMPRTSAGETIPDKLRQLAALRDADVITVEDFQTTKADLLRRL
jgi:hypothetical protein